MWPLVTAMGFLARVNAAWAARVGRHHRGITVTLRDTIDSQGHTADREVHCRSQSSTSRSSLAETGIPWFLLLPKWHAFFSKAVDASWGYLVHGELHQSYIYQVHLYLWQCIDQWIHGSSDIASWIQDIYIIYRVLTTSILYHNSALLSNSIT